MRRLARPLALLAVAASVVAAGCTGAPGTVAVPLRPALADLRVVRIPVYLPARLPPAPAGEHYTVFAHGSADTYSVTVVYTKRPARVNPDITFPASALVGVFVGGPAKPTVLEAAMVGALPGRGHRVRLNGGPEATFVPGQGIAWSQRGWIFIIADPGARPASAAALAPMVHRLRAAAARSPGLLDVARTGEVIVRVLPGEADIRAFWVRGADGYQVWGHDVSGMVLAATLVRARP